MFEVQGDDWRHLVDCHYDNEYDCENYGCNDEGICRCSRVVDVTVDSSTRGCLYFLQNAFPGSRGLDQALRFWFIRRNLPDVRWDWRAEGDYYGEVLSKVYPEGDFYNKFELFECMTDQEKIHSLLTQEYGKVLPSLKDITDWEMKPVFISEVQQTANRSTSSLQVSEYERICQDILADSRSRGEFQQHVQYLAPLCVKRGKFYQVIDGTHRTIALTSTYQVSETKKNGKGSKLGTFVPLFMWIICPKEK